MIRILHLIKIRIKINHKPIMLGQKRSTVKTNASFWSQLENDLEKYSERARKNIKAYEKIQYKCLYERKTQKPKK